MTLQSTYCATMVQHCEALNRSVQVVNLDPAAEHFNYSVMAGKSEQSLPPPSGKIGEWGSSECWLLHTKAES